MKYNLTLVVLGVFFSAFFLSCNRQKENKEASERFTSNKSKVVVDEAFRPIVDEELYIFKALDSLVHPTLIYTTENDAVNILLEDTARIAILSRDLTPAEYKVLNARTLKPVVNRFAIDAIALIVNQASNDTNITVGDIKKMLNGDTKQDKNIVFDNPNSGLVRYLKELSGNPAFKQKNIYALKSNKEVINYVSQHPDAIGITDFSWLNDPDKDYADAVQKVKIVNVKDDGPKSTSNEYFSPSQNTMALKQYPLTRNLYILNCTGNFGLGKKLESFLESDPGQRIILKSGLLPDLIPSRRINITQKIKQ